VGYTDNVGTESYNQALSLKRAEAIANYIKNTFGISDTMMYVEGKGISLKYSDPEQNRRVEIYIYR